MDLVFMSTFDNQSMSKMIIYCTDQRHSMQHHGLRELIFLYFGSVKSLPGSQDQLYSSSHSRNYNF